MKLREIPIRDALRERLLVWDGAMGTMLYERGVFINQNYDEVCVSRPEIVRRIHEDYLTAGAQVLETNTFGSNVFQLARWGHESKVREINLAGVRIAREVAGDVAFVAGSIGPTGIVPSMSPAEDLDRVRATFREQASALAEGGADLVVLETFRHIDEIRMGIEAVRTTSDLPVVALMTFDTNATVADGSTPEDVATKLASWGADAVGVNCSDGPQLADEVAQRMLCAGLPVCALPNAGLPRRIDGRLIYMASPEYFGTFARRVWKAGVRHVGGCCGSMPEHIRKVAAAARMLDHAATAVSMPEAPPAGHVPAGCAPLPLAQKSTLGRKIAEGKFVVSVEVNPDAGFGLEKYVAGVKMLQDAGIDVINTADGPRATARVSNLAWALRVQQELGMEVLLHVCCRDRNLIGLTSHVLGAWQLGIKNLVIITGDPPRVGDFPEATAVYDIDSIGLLRLVSNMNCGIDPGGKAMPGQTAFVCATGVEPGARDFEREMKRLRLKKEAGADFVMTQPVYDPALIDRFLGAVEGVGLPVLLGLLPLASYRNAEFLHNEVPGMQIPEEIRERMRKAGSGAPARAEGVAIAREALAAAKGRIQGAYVMPPFNRFEAALEVLEGLI